MAVKVDDIELIKSFQAGDPDAFTNVVGQYREPLFRHAMRRLNNVAAAEDAVQETFFRAYRAFDRLRDDSRIGPWLHHILSNVCVDEANRRQRDTDKSARAGSDPFNTPIGPGVEEQLGLDVDNAPVTRALHTLPANYQQALTMRFVDELTYDEIAVSAGISEQNVRARVSRARTAMRAALRGVAAVPVFVLGLTRRSSRSAAALERVEHSHRAAMATEGAASVSKMATTLGPAIETVNAVAMSAHHSVPLATKAALGIGAVALATMSAGPERPEIPPPPVPVDATASAEADPDPVPAVVAAPQGSGQAATRQAPAPAPTPVAPVDQRAPAAAPAPGPSIEPVTADTAAPSTTAAPATTAAPTTAPSNVAPAPEPTDPAVEPPVLTGAAISVSGLSITPSGPRVDVAGSVSVKIGDVTHGGSMSGRLAIDAEADGSGRHRLEGTVTVSLADGTMLDLRLAGHAVPTGGSAPAPAPEPPSQPLPEPPTPPEGAAPGSSLGSGSGEHPTSEGDASVGDTAQVQPTAPAVATSANTTTTANRSYTISGQFRLAGGESLSLAGAGSFSGTFGPGTLALTLTP